MSQQASIRSLDCLQSLQQQLVIFLSQFSRAFESMSDDLKRSQNWLDLDQRQLWEMQLKKRQRMLEQAQAEMMSARMSEFVDSPNAQQMALRRAKVAVVEAEEKIAKIRYWSRQLPASTESILRSNSVLRFNMEADLKKAVAYLEQVMRILEDYVKTAGGEG